MNKSKIIFIELDGGSWNVIEPLIKQRRLPYVKQLKETGTFATLISDPPLISPKLWTSIFTGKLPQKHKIHFFGATSRDLKSKRIWDIFSQSGLKIGIFGSLVTWPPYPVNGYMIPSVFALDPKTYPNDYRFFQEILLNEKRKSKTLSTRESTLKDLVYYVFKLKSSGVRFKTLLDIFAYFALEKLRKFDDRDKYWRKVLLYQELCTDVFLYLYRSYSPDFSTFHIHVCDSMSHRFWKYYEPDLFSRVGDDEIEKYKNVIPYAYMEVDKTIGKILNSVSKETTVIIASDHGFEAVGKDSKVRYDLRVEEFVKLLGVSNQAIPAHIGMGIYLYFNDKQLMQKIAQVIENAVFEETNEKVFQSLLFDTYIGFRVPPKSWNTSVKKNTVICLGDHGKYSFFDLFTHYPLEQRTGEHIKEGILIINGPSIKAGRLHDDPSIYDIAPTILALMGFPAARDMDGRALVDAFTDEFLEGNAVKFIETYGDNMQKEEKRVDTDFDKVKERLKAIGYL